MFFFATRRADHAARLTRGAENSAALRGRLSGEAGLDQTTARRWRVRVQRLPRRHLRRRAFCFDGRFRTLLSPNPAGQPSDARNRSQPLALPISIFVAIGAAIHESNKMLGPRLLALLAVASAEPKEQWNGPAGAPKCVDKWQKWTDGFLPPASGPSPCSRSRRSATATIVTSSAPTPKLLACATKGPDGQGPRCARPRGAIHDDRRNQRISFSETVQVLRGASRASARGSYNRGPSQLYQLYQLHPRR